MKRNTFFAFPVALVLTLSAVQAVNGFADAVWHMIGDF